MPGFLDLFKKSPFGPLVEHLEMVTRCIGKLKPLFCALIEEDKPQVRKLTKEISKLEHKADEIKNAIRQNLPKGLFLPVNRGDLLAYLKLQDSIADTVEDIAVLVTMKKMRVPDQLKESLIDFVDKILAVWETSHQASRDLNTLVEVAFSGYEADKVLDLISETERREWEADCQGLNLAKKLFKLEGEISPVDIMLWFKIFDVMGDLANHCEKNAEMLRRFLCK